MSFTLAEARAADAADTLRPLRERFHLPEGLIYLDGNSLGPMPKKAAARLGQVVAEALGDPPWPQNAPTQRRAGPWIGGARRGQVLRCGHA